MSKLYEIVSRLESSNAGATHFVFDVIFASDEKFRGIVKRKIITKESVAKAYKLKPEQVQVYEFPPAHAIIVAVPRPTMNGNPDDTDVDGAAQHLPLMMMEV